MSKNIVVPSPISSIDSATFTGAYQLVATLAKAALLLRIINNSNSDVTVSFDGTTDNEFVPDGAVFQFPVQSNAGATNYAAFIAQGTKIYVKGTALSTGLVYVASYYQPAS